jgi:hypothetical protein
MFFNRRRKDRHWVEQEEVASRKWILEGSRDDYLKSERDQSAPGLGFYKFYQKNGTYSKPILGMATVLINYKCRYWHISVDDQIDFWESVMYSDFSHELVCALENFCPLMSESVDYLEDLKKSNHWWWFSQNRPIN